jgi:hypothetical protein
MTVRRAATLALLSWTLVVTEPTPRTIKTGFPTKDAGEEAAKDANSGQSRLRPARSRGTRGLAGLANAAGNCRSAIWSGGAHMTARYFPDDPNIIHQKERLRTR